MKPESALIELLQRVGVQNGGATFISAQELSGWPAVTVAAMKSQELIKKARPAVSVVCPGCERECIMPVHVRTAKGREPDAFIVCDKRDDVSRVAVAGDLIEQWQCSGDAIAALLSMLLGLHRSEVGATAARWDLGVFKGVKHSSHIVLLADGQLTISLAGHTVSLADTLIFDGKALNVDRRMLTRLVDKPVAGAGDAESSEQRKARLEKRVQDLKAKGVRAFLKEVAEEEGIHVSRLKQILGR